MIGWSVDACPAHGRSVSGNGALPLRCWQKTGAVCRAMQRPVYGLASGMVRQSVTITAMWEAKRIANIRSLLSSWHTRNPRLQPWEYHLTGIFFSFSAHGRRRCAFLAMMAAARYSLSCHAAASVRPGGGMVRLAVTIATGGVAEPSIMLSTGRRSVYLLPHLFRRQQFLRLRRGRRGRSGLSRCTVGASAQMVRFLYDVGRCPVQSVVPCSCQCPACQSVAIDS